MSPQIKLSSWVYNKISFNYLDESYFDFHLPSLDHLMHNIAFQVIESLLMRFPDTMTTLINHLISQLL